jgi:hydrogenase maturation protease
VADGCVVVCLGNDLIADDALGPEAATALRAQGIAAHVVESSEGGLALLDEVLGFEQLVVVDTVLTGSAPPGTVHVVWDDALAAVPGGAPHAVGIFEALALGRALGLAVPTRVSVVAVEAADLVGIGCPMTPEVRSALDTVVNVVADLVDGVNAPGSPAVARR